MGTFFATLILFGFLLFLAAIWDLAIWWTAKRETKLLRNALNRHLRDLAQRGR
jgi:hypothetical protein